MPLICDSSKQLSILCLGAHSDDIEIGCGGSLLKIFKAYNVSFVKWMVFSSNETRKKEAIKSASLFLKNVQSRDIEVLDYRDGFLPQFHYEIKDRFEKIKTEINPDIIFTHNRTDRHQDHCLVSDLSWNTFRNHTILEYEIPKYDGDLGIPNFFIPIDETLVEEKVNILMTAFTSQKNKHWFDKESFTSLMRIRGMESAVKYAEAFYARKLVFN